MINLVRTNSANSDFKNLVSLLDEDLAQRDGDEHAFYAQYNGISQLNHVLIAYLHNEPVACGAFKAYDSSIVEIKRMFVLPEYRGKGIAGQVLKELERWASEELYKSCILETGKKQPEAIRLYEKSGYRLIPNYGQYTGIENSVCMQKIIR